MITAHGSSGTGTCRRPDLRRGFSASGIRVSVEAGVSYGSDPELVRNLLLPVADADDRVVNDPAPVVRFTEFGDSALLFELQCWIPTIGVYADLPSDVRFPIVRAFRDHHVAIPFPKREVHLRSGSAS